MPKSINTPRAYGDTLGKALFKKTPEDFIVNETLVFEPEGEGEHVYLYIKKRNTNTQWLAAELAKFANIKQRDISYAGLKDRNAVTRQWFSLLLHKDKEPDWSEFKLEGIDILKATRHRSKLRPGMAKINQFIITLHETDCDEAALKQRIELINQFGVPNYFGEQRFGHDDNNLVQARLLFEGKIKVKQRNKKGLYLSAARSDLFNSVLAERVRQGNWNKAVTGDCMMLEGSHSFFGIEKVDNEIIKRVNEYDIHPTGPLWGCGEPLSTQDCLLLEDDILNEQQLFKRGLEMANMKMDRRSLGMKPVALEYEQESPHIIKLAFGLSAGQYATTLLHELFDYHTGSI